MAINKTIKTLFLGLSLSLASLGTQAAVMTVNFNYTGSTLFNLAGNFSYDAATAGTMVDKTELLSFKYDVFAKADPATPLFGYVLSDLQSRVDFIFNFDTVNQQLTNTRAAPQRWQIGSFGFATNAGRDNSLVGQATIRDGTDIDTVVAANFASAMKYHVSTVPEPESSGLILVGLGLMGAVLRRRQQV
ncbi:PEP-CTERM sorting domain-containing protein [Methylophilus sp. UBA6697]|uniref:PEP-CTERM sorting domain-containing protein n=1 Tax=Methylophilus sp. UBA6697 TaxID=1946902 RepID=UPI0025DD4589|nr:PEP-CTERM sorting domain-containing protein [Methylophilus sp. UBA6697]